MGRSSSAPSPPRRGPTTATALTSLLVLAACGQEAGAPRQSVEVDGTVVLDGEPRVVTRCEVTPAHASVYLRLHLDGGAVVTYDEEARAFYVSRGGAPGRGEPYPCTSGAARHILWGTGTAGTFFHGGLSFACARQGATVTADLTLRCGVVDEATRARHDQAIEEARGK